MLENSRKRSRKSKLELREGVELEEASFVIMQVKKELQDKEPEESDAIHENTAIAVVKTENNLEIDPIQYVAPTPTRKHPSVMEFSVKVEVEECDITDMNESNAESKTGEEKKTDDDVTTGVVTVDSKSNVFVAASAQKPSIKVETSDKNAYERSLLKIVAKEVKEFKEYSTNRQMILRIIARLLKSSNIADRILAIGIRNYAGRVQEQVKEVVFKNVLQEWNSWYQEHSAVRDSPLLFKCYICGKSYWHLYEFREHVHTHKKEQHVEHFQLTIETRHDECYIVYFMHDLIKKPIKFPSGECLKCGKPANTHTFANINIKNYKCDACKLTFSTCTQLSMHEMRCAAYKNSLDHKLEELKQCSICESGFYTESTLQKHLSMSHSVRSDIVMTWEVIECPVCNQPFIVAALHICAKKTNNYGCNYCGRSFQKKIYKELHIQNCHKSVQCKICYKYLVAACMEPSHLLQHTDRYALMYKCLECSIDRYFSDESSIIYHTETIHNRKFEKKFKYLEMVVLPKQCLDRISKQPQPAENTREALPMKVTSRPCGNNEQVTTLKRKFSENIGNFMQVMIKEEPEDSAVNSQICVVSEVKSKKTEDSPEEQVTSNSMLADDELEDVIIVEKEDDVISLNSNESYEETTCTRDNIIPTRKKRKRVTKHPCVCGYKTTAKRLIVHKKRCAVLRSRRKKRTRSSEGEDHDEPEDDNAEKSDPPDDDDEDSDYKEDGDGGGDDDDDDHEEFTINRTKQERRGRPWSLTYVCSCKFKGNYKEFKLHRLECNKRNYLIRRPKKKVLITCTKCNTVFYELRNYCEHFHRIHGYKKNTCPFCMRQFDCVEDMETDVTGHVKHIFIRITKINEGLEGTKCIVCKNCQKPVESKDYYSHWESHLELKDLETEPESAKELIDEDGDGMFSAELMKNIIENLQSTVTSRLSRLVARKCVVCLRQFDRVNDAKRHLVEHLLADALMKKQRFGALRCQICAKNLPKQDSYRHHMRKHGSLPLYQCEVCSKSFSDSSNFCKHKKVHNLSVLHCTICEKKFQNRVQMVKHMEMHENTKPAICELCSRVFFSQSSYKKHYRSSHEKRPRYLCFVCRQSFSRVRDKWDHMWLAHEERKVKADCPLCDHSYRLFHDVKSHVRYAHQRDVKRAVDGSVKLVCEAIHPAVCNCCPEKNTRGKPRIGPRTDDTVMTPRVNPAISVVNPELSEISERTSEMMEIVFKFEEDDPAVLPDVGMN